MKLSAPQRQAVILAIRSARAAAAQHPHWPPALPRVQVAQFCLESAYGRSFSGKNNPFGIKARAGAPGTTKPTWEDTNGPAPGGEVRLPQRFRDFATLAEAFAFHGQLLTTRRRRGSDVPIYAAALRYPADPHGFARALTGVYATDPAYGDKLVRILDGVVQPLWDLA